MRDSTVPTGIVNPISNTDKSVTLQKLINGYINLSSSFTSCGQVFNTSKQIIVGSPTPKGIVFDSENPLCINERYPRGVKGATVLDPIAGAIYEWRVNNIIRGTNEPGINIIHSWCITGTNTVSVRSFFCGTWGNPLQVNFEAQYCEPEGFRSYAVSPNPSTNTITVASKGFGTIEEIRVKDKFGNSRVTKRFANKSSSVLLDISFLPSDIYIVEIFDGKKWHAEKIIKN